MKQVTPYKIVLMFSLLMTYSVTASVQDCELPLSLVGSRILIGINGMHAPTSAKAFNLQALTFTETQIQDMNMTTGETSRGTYSYNRLSSGIGLLDVKLTQGPEQSIYREVLVCKTALIGKFIFSQTQGMIKPDIRQDSGTYIIQTHISQ
ncbi:hypothetical protein [Shewanella surugensis]|uniref:Uncharacterized protein n=1 Tax=Shewanella surugensis TaxID=212020 RepID=A0ABT0LIP2_9GAMM|nr:hypothetical protein [Shewanella surugensis]MCL1127167.1 hypothetical protein [Shewanella surugensis]